MKVTYFRIENFRNIKIAECTNPPDFMVICGGNGSGKSALLNALMTAKEHAAPYGGFYADPRTVSADSEKATITMHLQFSKNEQEWYKKQFDQDCPESDNVVIEIKSGGSAKALKRSAVIKNILSWYSRAYKKSPGFFDYIDSHRITKKKQISTWNTSGLSDANFKQTLVTVGTSKFNLTKDYLASLVMHDLQEIQASHRSGETRYPDSLKDIRDFFNDFFAPMEFVNVHIDSSPFKYIIRTPRGDIDIDDLSGGEKEILNTFIHFHQLHPKEAVILFDEADAHLHPDLERRYLEVLRSLGEGNQLWITTHSPEMMIAAGSESLYTILKSPPHEGGNQFVQVSTSDSLHEALADLMGSRGFVSFNQKIVFIEGEESSADRYIFEHFYPPGKFNVSFVPAGNSGTVRKTSERVNELLTSSIGFQEYFSIVDGDIERATEPPPGDRLKKLPVYHIENFLLDEQNIYDVTIEMLAEKCPYSSANEVTAELLDVLLSEEHIRPLARAVLDARVSSVAKDAWDAVYAGKDFTLSKPKFENIEDDVKKMMQQAIKDGDWRAKCKGRALIKGYCGRHRIKYEHFRNLLLNRMSAPPSGLKAIMDSVINSNI